MLPKYFNDYTWSNISAMLRNNGRTPKICTDGFKDRLVVITGATSGIGYHTARKFASHGARLILINRNREKSEALKTEIENDFGVRCDYFIADLSDLNEVRNTAEYLLAIAEPIDVLVHNAGIYLTKRNLTPEGFDRVFVVQHLAPFMINVLLREKLRAQESARIILVNSEGHRFAAWGLQIDDLNWEKRRYSGLKSYGSAKLSQLLTMMVFDEYFRNTGVTINAMHPGAVRSDTGKENGPVYRWIKKNFYSGALRPTEISSESIYYLAVSEELKGISGKFFNLTTREDPAPPATDRAAAREIWAESLKMTKLDDFMPKP